MSYLDETDQPVEQLLEELEADFYWVRCDALPDGRSRVRVERHSGRTFYDYRATTTAASGMETAIRRAYRKVREAEVAGEVQELCSPTLAAVFLRRQQEASS